MSEVATLVCWDFDHSLVNDNSDTWVVEQLAPELMPEFSRLRRDEQLGWTDIMARQMQSLHARGVTEVQLRACLASLPMQPQMIEAVRLAQAAGATQARLKPGYVANRRNASPQINDHCLLHISAGHSIGRESFLH